MTNGLTNNLNRTSNSSDTMVRNTDGYNKYWSFNKIIHSRRVYCLKIEFKTYVFPPSKEYCLQSSIYDESTQ